MAGANTVDWVGLIAILASLPPLWIARRFWNSAEPARLLMSRVLMGDGTGFLFGGLIVIVTAQWEWAVAALMFCAVAGAGLGLLAMRRAAGQGNGQ